MRTCSSTATTSETNASTLTTFGTISASPSAVIPIATKIGFLLTLNGPSTTRSVRSVGSTPTRHDDPIASCTQNVPNAPTNANTTPTPCTAGECSGRRSSRPANDATGAARPTETATMNARNAHTR